VFGGLANGILLGMNGSHAMFRSGAVFVGDPLHLVADFIAMGKPHRGADISGYQQLFVPHNDTPAFAPVTGGSLRNGIGHFNKVFIPGRPVVSRVPVPVKAHLVLP
jgi:hypothetical protein